MLNKKQIEERIRERYEIDELIEVLGLDDYYYEDYDHLTVNQILQRHRGEVWRKIEELDIHS